MPAYNFKKQFAPDVESGVKRQTVRPKRKRPTKPGEPLSLYTGMRTKYCRLLKNAICKSVDDIEIGSTYVKLNGKKITIQKINELAKADGFRYKHQFFNFFETQYGLPFNGDLIKW